MRVAQIVVTGASEYERKSQRIDAAVLAAAGHAIVPAGSAEIAHVYAPPQFPASAVRDLRVPYVASSSPEQGLFRRASEPRGVITPEVVPEAVEEGWFELTRDVLTVDG